jgi:hypothetical protein
MEEHSIAWKMLKEEKKKKRIFQLATIILTIAIAILVVTIIR